MNQTQQIRTLVQGTELLGRRVGTRLELLEPAPMALVVYFGDDPEAGLRDLFRVHVTMQRHADLLRRVGAEELDTTRATRDRLHDEIATFVGPARGWAHALLRHQSLRDADRVLNRGVVAAEAVRRRQVAERIAELVGPLEQLDLPALCLLEHES